MRSLFLLNLALLGGCSPLIDAQLGLIDASRKGLARVTESIDDRASVILALQAGARERLDAAFDADVRSQPIDARWVIDARKAYAAAIDALNAQSDRAQQAAAVDRANLSSVDQALQQLQLINRTQLQLVPNLGTFLKGTP